MQSIQEYLEPVVSKFKQAFAQYDTGSKMAVKLVKENKDKAKKLIDFATEKGMSQGDLDKVVNQIKTTKGIFAEVAQNFGNFSGFALVRRCLLAESCLEPSLG